MKVFKPLGLACGTRLVAGATALGTRGAVLDGRQGVVARGEGELVDRASQLERSGHGVHHSIMVSAHLEPFLFQFPLVRAATGAAFPGATGRRALPSV